MADNSIIASLKYSDNKSRVLTIADVADSVMSAETVETKVKAINASLSAGTAGGLSSFFLSDEGGYLVELSEVKLKSVTTTPIVSA